MKLDKRHKDYIEWLNNIKSKIRITQIKAALSANSELIRLYWGIGKDIFEKQEIQGWGNSIVENKYGKWNFVEVKTTLTDKLEFKISNLEVNFGIENKSNYEIMIVTNALDEKKNRRIKRLSNPFKFTKDESFTNNSKFLVKNENFTIELNED